MSAGSERVTRRGILQDGQVINRVAPTGRYGAMVFQSHALYPQMTLTENLESALRMAGVPHAPARAREQINRAAETALHHLRLAL